MTLLLFVLNILCLASAITGSSNSSRLPTDLKPKHYNLHLKPYIDGDWSVEGKIEVTLLVQNDTNMIILNMADIITKNETAMVQRENGENLGIVKQSYDAVNQFYILELSEILKPNETIKFSVDYIGLLNENLVGFYRSSYNDASGNKRWLASTQFSPTDARRAFPCWDEPNFKATFSISITRLKEMMALSNMPVIRSEPIDDAWVQDWFDKTLPMSTYIVGFLVCDFSFLSSSQLNHTQFKVWSRPDAIEQTEYAKDIAPRILTFLEIYFNLTFPLPKLDMAAIPDFKFNGMENWGLIMYRETAMMYDAAVTSALDKSDVAYVIGHEIAHQWFGNLVTPNWWSDLWLKEGFASYIGYIAVNEVEPTWGMMDQFVVDYLQLVLSLDSLVSTHPINVEVDHPDQISEIFDLISYRKGASIIRMMQHFLTEPTFRAGLTTYLQDLKYSNAKQDDLWSHLTTAGHLDGTLPQDVTVKEVMDSWTLQEGYPVVHVSAVQDGLLLTQKRFLLSNNADNTTKYLWWVPVSYTTEDNPSFTNTLPQFWLKNESMKITDQFPNDKWVLFNIQQTGYYRVNYDTGNWRSLIGQLNNNHTVIHQSNRAQLLDDSLNLARAGEVDYAISLSMTEYLESEIDYIVWNAALTNLQYIYTMFGKESSFGALKEYLLKKITPLYNHIGFEDNIEDPFLTQNTRVLSVKWACRLGHTSCTEKAQELFNRWIETPSNNSLIGANTIGTVLCTGIASGGETEWNKLWDVYLASNIGAQREHILSALGCTKKIWILARYLDMCFDESSGVRKQDAPRVFSAVATNIIGNTLAWNYLREHWNSIRNYFGPGSSTLPKLIGSVTDGFNSKTDLTELLEFQSTSELGSAVRAVEQAVESTRLNIQWMNEYYQIIVDWLKSNGFNSLLF